MSSLFPDGPHLPAELAPPESPPDAATAAVPPRAAGPVIVNRLDEMAWSDIATFMKLPASTTWRPG